MTHNTSLETILEKLPPERRARVLETGLELARVETALQAMRSHSGLTQTELAASMGIAQPAVSRLEKGEADVLLSSVVKYASAAGYTARLVFEAEAAETFEVTLADSSSPAKTRASTRK